MAIKFLASLFGGGPARPVAEQHEVAEIAIVHELETSQASLVALRSELRLSGADLPTVAYSQFWQIDDLVSALVAYMQRSGASTEQRVLLDAIITDYLPTSLRKYLMLPSSARREDSPESRVLFVQLATLYSTSRNLDEQVRSGAATELAIHGRFLKDKFDLSSLHLEGI